MKSFSNDDWALILVSAQLPIEDDFKVDLSAVPNGKFADSRVVPYLLDMIADAQKCGVELLIRSAHRSIEYQEKLYNNKIKRLINDEGVSEDKAPDMAAMVVARPKTSEHHTGLAFDILSGDHDFLDEDFKNTRAYEWLMGNAHKYGFVLRYRGEKTPITGIVFEPWHWRFVGLTHANAMRQKEECLEEYISK